MSHPASSWIEVYSGLGLQADLITAVLEANEIRCQRLSVGGNAFGGLAFEFCSILVPAAEAEAARAVIDSAPEPS